ncbi:hypothetical protein [Aquimarina rhabdastrellae]
MLKSILNLKEVNIITKKEQTSISGGMIPVSICCDFELSCCTPNIYYNGRNCEFLYSTNECI